MTTAGNTGSATTMHQPPHARNMEEHRTIHSPTRSQPRTAAAQEPWTQYHGPGTRRCRHSDKGRSEWRVGDRNIPIHTTTRRRMTLTTKPTPAKYRREGGDTNTAASPGSANAMGRLPRLRNMTRGTMRPRTKRTTTGGRDRHTHPATRHRTQLRTPTGRDKTKARGPARTMTGNQHRGEGTKEEKEAKQPKSRGLRIANWNADRQQLCHVLDHLHSYDAILLQEAAVPRHTAGQSTEGLAHRTPTTLDGQRHTCHRRHSRSH